MNKKKYSSVILFIVLIGVLLTMTACTKKCIVGGCDKDVVEGMDYCEEHLCDVDDCPNEVSANNLCEEHLCDSEGCPNQVLEGRAFCEEHLCNAPDCEQEVVRNEKYCDDHLCDRKGCHNYIGKNVGAYCEDCKKLMCSAPDCEKDKVKGSNYCKNHKCKQKGCPKKRTNKGYCKKHYKSKLNSAFSKLNKRYDSVEDITWYEPTCMPQYINSSSTFYIYIGRSGDNYWLRWKGVYLADDWVFFDNIVINIDGERHTKNFDYSDDIVRDSSYGDIWEVFDIVPTSSDIELLKKISKSNKTVIRYKGDTYYGDRTITAEQKRCIKEVLAVWELIS